MKRYFLGCIVAIGFINATEAADMQDLAREILDPKTSAATREALIANNAPEAPTLLDALVNDLPVGTPEEYRRIPWIWRVSLAVGKGNEAKQIRRVLESSLPASGEPLQHWQAVVIGGGIINGLGLEGRWPGDEITRVVKGDAPLAGRWNRALELAAAMADDEKVPAGTRYDALRMIALRPWNLSGAQLSKYLEKGVNAELQQGAISGMADMKSAPVAEPLIANLGHFTAANRTFALNALLREEARREKLREAIKAGKIKDLPPEVAVRLQE